MTQKIKSAPYLHGEETSVGLKADMLIGLLSVIAVAVVQNGFRVLSLCILSAAAGWIAESIGLIIFKKGRFAGLHSISMGLIIALLCPVTVPIWLPAAASAFSVLFVDVILWPNYSRLFMTPAIGWIFMLSIAPSKIVNYPAIRYFGAFPLFDDINDFQIARSIAQSLQYNKTPPYSFSDLLVGDYPGGIGTTCILIILAVCIYFIFRKSMAWQVSLSMIVTVSAFALVINRTGGNILTSVLYELTASAYIFVAVFVSGDIISAPMLTRAKIAYGIIIGILTMLFRYIGFGEHCVVFSLIIANLVSQPLDLVALKIQIKSQRKKSADKLA